MAKLDRKLFFQHLENLFQLSLTDDEQEHLNSVFERWDRYFPGQDERMLAHVLATVHHAADEAAGTEKSGEPVEPASTAIAEPTAQQSENPFAAVNRDNWLKVREISADSQDTDALSRLSNMFYTALAYAKTRPIPLARVLSAELRHVRRDADDSHNSLEDVFKEFHKRKLTALCFSGGGIRSATFGLGIAQKLAERGLLSRFDYLSTVSGGGYLGSWLSAWTRRERVKKAAKYEAVDTTSAAEIQRSSDVGVQGLSDIQIVVLYMLSSTATAAAAKLGDVSALRAAAKLMLPLTDEDAKSLSGAQIKVLHELATGTGAVKGLTNSQLDELRRLTPDEREILFNDPEFYNAGILSVEEQINCIDITSGDRPTPEPVQLRHLREYSNYMSPKTGLLSADTWTLIAIYLRNLLLNLTIFVPLIAAVLMLPRFLFLVVVRDGAAFESLWRMMFAGLLIGCAAIAFVICRLPSKRESEESRDKRRNKKGDKPRAKPFLNTDSGVLIFGVVPLLVSGFLAATVWAWNYRLDGNLLKDSFFYKTPWLGANEGLGFFLVTSAIAFGAGMFLFFIFSRFRGIVAWEAAAALIASVTGGALVWLLLQKVFNPVAWSAALGPRFAAYEWQVYQCLSVPAFLLIVLIAATIFVGLSSRQVTDEDREWLARYGGWVLILGCVWIALNALVLLGPSVLQWMFRPLFGESKIDWKTVFSPDEGLTAVLSVIVGVVSGIVSLAGGFSSKSLVRDEPVKSRTSKFLAWAPQIAAVVFLGFILAGLAFLTTAFIQYLADPLATTIYHAAVLQNSTQICLLAVFLVLAAVGFFMACFVNVNKFSLHGAYRDRLTRAYLGASNPDRNQNTFTGFDDSDNLELHALEGQRPFHVINATVNLVGGKNLAWQNRKAASFTMTPLHCGSWAVKGFRRSKDYCVSHTTGKALRLGTAMAISGAAANPNMGYMSSPVVTFLMSMFNIRLGWWLGNTGPAGSDIHWFGLGNRRFFEKVSPSIAVFPLINETLGRTDESKHFLNVTDGGHFENLGLYEMILRRCRLIILSDGAADHAFKFGEISNAIQKCKVDLGVDIKFTKGIKIVSRDTDADGKKKAVRYAIADITYPEKVDGEHLTGKLLYTRPAYYDGDEYTDIKHYAEANTKFPHQSTGDQMYDEKQFEAYRGLGFFTMEQIIKTEGDSVLADFLKSLSEEA